MGMTRHYFLSDDLDDLDAFEEELEEAELLQEQIHLISNDEYGVQRHIHLEGVVPFLQRGSVRASIHGAMIIAIAGAVALGVAHVNSMAANAANWLPLLGVIIAILAFLSWGGGLRGVAVPSLSRSELKEMLADGKHVMYVDVRADQESQLRQTAERHPAVQDYGIGSGAAEWRVSLEHRISRMFQGVIANA